jgi:hypothetical protein
VRDEQAATRSASNVEAREGVKHPEQIEQPENRDDHHNAIQDRLHRRLHWDEAVHSPEQDSHENERDYDLQKRHIPISLSQLLEPIGIVVDPDRQRL